MLGEKVGYEEKIHCEPLHWIIRKKIRQVMLYVNEVSLEDKILLGHALYSLHRALR